MPVNPPPLLFSFESGEQLKSALSIGVRTNYGKQIDRLIEAKLPPIASIGVLAVLLGLSPKFIGSMRLRKERYYRTFEIRKGAKVRRIDAPRVALKLIQAWFSQHVARAIQFDDCVYGFIKTRSHVEAAARHCGAEWVYSIDIQDFFGSITFERVVTSLIEIGYGEHGARLLADLCTKGGVLPQGSPASPVLSNLVFSKMDQYFRDLSFSHGVIYTRYADDLVFSGKGSFPVGFDVAAKAIVENDGWRLSLRKETFSRAPSRRKVHGLLVNSERPRLTKGYRNKIRAYRHIISMGKVLEQDGDRLRGHVAFADYVDSVTRNGKQTE